MPAALDARSLRALLLPWYRAQRRDLPWRRTRDPYAIWLSEAMLQQTRVETVIPYWKRFLARFPTVADLAAAPEADVLALWSGLGYYRRARALHAAARVVVADFDGALPDTVAALKTLPGVGEYTAGAVASIAFDRPAPLVDGNVARVFCRVFAIGGDPSGGPVRRRLWSEARRLVPRDGSAGDWNQGLMELGAMVCTPREPACGACPWAQVCRARALGRVARLPAARARRAAVSVELELAWVVHRGRVLLEERPLAGRMAGLLQLPTRELAGPGGPPSGLFPQHFTAPARAARGPGAARAPAVRADRSGRRARRDTPRHHPPPHPRQRARGSLAGRWARFQALSVGRPYGPGRGRDDGYDRQGVSHCATGPVQDRRVHAMTEPGPAGMLARLGGIDIETEVQAQQGDSSAEVEARRSDERVSAQGITIVVPVYNEERGVAAVVERLSNLDLGVPVEVLLVNDGSSDGTAPILQQLERDHDLVRVVAHPANRGYGAALKTGFAAAANDVVVITDADGTYPEGRIRDLIDCIDDGAEMAVGARVGENVNIPLIRRPAKAMLRGLASFLAGTPIPDLNSGLRAFRRELVLKYRPILPEGFSFTTTITLAALTNHHRVDYVTINYAHREGQSKIRPIKDTLGFTALIIRTVLYFNPLKVFYPFALFLGLVFLGMMSYDIFFGKDIGDKTVVIFFALLQVLTVGLLADLIEKKSRL